MILPDVTPEWWEAFPFDEAITVLCELQRVAPDDEWRFELSFLTGEHHDPEFVYERMMDAVWLFTGEGDPDLLARLPAAVLAWYDRAMDASLASMAPAAAEVFGGTVLGGGPA